MAALDNLIEQIDDPALKKRIQEELKRTTSKRKFGLVYEEHLPECTPLYNTKIRKGSTVAVINEGYDVIYTVVRIDGNDAYCIDRKTKEQRYLSLDELIAVARFGDPIYPYLEKIDQIENAPDDDTWNALIEADNYHALQLLQYLYPHKVDCIYIDPPYNTGDRTWKYNNDYVDSNDVYKHSKWLSFMEKRLNLAKGLLNPNDSVLICTIDEKEYLHLGMLLEQMFPNARIQMVSDVTSHNGNSREMQFARTNEFIFFVMFGDSRPEKLNLNSQWLGNLKVESSKSSEGFQWGRMLRGGNSGRREYSPGCFYPIYIDHDGVFRGLGDPLPNGVDRNTVKPKDGLIAIWPIHLDGTEGCWSCQPSLFLELYKKGYIKFGDKITDRGVRITYIQSGMRKRIENGEIKIVGREKKNGTVILDTDANDAKYVPGTQWSISSHDATYFGTKLISSIIGRQKFTFPKSLYSVHDVIRFFVANKPNALVLDFFAGSGTTLHAVNLLNAEDGGHRKCIIVTNNEVSEKESKSLKANGYKPGDPEWEKYGVARYVTWPRTVCSIKGVDIKGKKLEGDYGTYHDEYVPVPNKKGLYKKNKHVPDDSSLAEIKKSDGFRTNVIYFKLGFLDKNAVSLGRQFAELLPLLWMKAGAFGPCPTVSKDNIPPMLILPENRMAILVDDKQYAIFIQRLNQSNNIQTVYLVTDSDDNYRDMIKGLKGKTTYQLYRDYLDNFKVNGGTY